MPFIEQIKSPVYAAYSNHPIQIGFHSHLEYEIYYFHGGICHYLIGDQIHRLVPGDLILMNGTTLHSPKIDPNEEYQRTIVHFDAEVIRSLLKPPLSTPLLKPFDELGNVRITLTSDQQSLIEPLLSKLCRLNRHSPLVQDRLLLTTLELLTEIYEIARNPQVIKSTPSVKEQNVQRLISYIESHYTEDIDLDAISSYMHLNKYHLVKIFREITGITIFNYLYKRRINQAKVLFTIAPDRAVTEVAYEVGFKYPSHFSRLFKNCAGISPDGFRKAAAGEFPLTNIEIMQASKISILNK